MMPTGDEMRAATAAIDPDTKTILLVMLNTRSLPYVRLGSFDMDPYLDERGLLNDEGLRIAAMVCLLDAGCTTYAHAKARKILEQGSA